ncbi:MAG: winged helix-turn-helix transcriptional regulator [Chloroflexi bacterium]|nr:winged helix-turn-helix transcriptional regulator [Chloroflexota bacterium]
MQSSVVLTQLCDLLDTAHTLQASLGREARIQTGLRLEQLVVLFRIESSGGNITVSQLAAANSRASHTMTSMVTNLEKAGLVVRERQEKGDRRQVWVRLTPEGEAKTEAFRCSTEAIIASVLSSVTDEELLDRLAGITQGIRRLFKGPPTPEG